MAETGIYEEWRTRNEQRRYPFADDALLLDTVTGRRLPDSVFIDAMFYPINTSGQLYLSDINISESKAYISDSSGVVATAVIAEDLFSFYDDYGRLIGVMVPGSGFSIMDSDMHFTAVVAPLAQACVCTQNYNCLNGILLPDGTLLTGHIFWEGEAGIKVSTEYMDGVPVIRLDAIGVSDLPACLPLTKPLKCIKVSQVGSGGALAVAQVENTILFSTPYSLQDVCGMFAVLPDNEGNLPVDKDACLPPIPVVCPAPPPFTGNCPVESYAEYFIWPNKDTIGISLVQSEPVFTQDSASEFALANNSINLPPRPRQGLRLYLKGVNNG